jgi:putative membrane protein
MKTKMFFVMLMTAFMGATAQTNEKDAKEMNKKTFDGTSIEDDVKFVAEVADASMLEVKVGILAESMATSQEVKELAQMMVKDHTKANAELKALCDKKGIKCPTDLSNESINKHNDLSNEKKGEDFDKEYVKMMVKDHKKVIDMFEKEAKKGNEKEIRDWASKTLPTLKHHLEMSEAAEKALKKDKDVM